jgi:hypothetical protein
MSSSGGVAGRGTGGVSIRAGGFESLCSELEGQGNLDGGTLSSARSNFGNAFVGGSCVGRGGSFRDRAPRRCMFPRRRTFVGGRNNGEGGGFDITAHKSSTTAGKVIYRRTFRIGDFFVHPCGGIRTSITNKMTGNQSLFMYAPPPRLHTYIPSPAIIIPYIPKSGRTDINCY